MIPAISRAAAGVPLSRAVANRRKADELAARGVAIVDFGMGEPDFDPPEPVVEAAITALRAGESNYVDPRGLPTLRERIAAFETARHGHPVGPERVVVTSGSFCALSIASRAILDPGDEVLIPEPFWGPYRNIVQLAGGVAIPVPAVATQGRFSFDPDRLRALVTPRTRAIVINSPNNPTGRVFTRDELAVVAELAEARNLWIVADEVYSELVYDGHRHVSIASLAPAIADRTIIVNSFSKTWAMTGWRLGFAIARPEAAEAMARINHYTVRCATSFVQHAAVAGFEAGWPGVERMLAAYARRRRLVAERMARLPGVRFVPPEGAFYAFPEVPAEWGDGDAVARRWLEDAGVVVSSGGAYGPSAAQFIRLSFATSDAAIVEGFDRIDRLVAGEQPY